MTEASYAAVHHASAVAPSGERASGRLPHEIVPSPASIRAEAGLDVAIIDDRLLVRECFRRSLALIDPSLNLSCFSHVDEFLAAVRTRPNQIQVAVVCIQWSQSGADAVLNRISHIAAADPALGVIVLSDAENVTDIQKTIERGARAYIPTSIGLEVALKAMHLVAAGGSYIPASVFSSAVSGAARKLEGADQPEGSDDVFTFRQLAVIEALRRGKANKIIAYELNMCESTVKVHVRNVMKKLNARNRTEVAYILSNRSAGGSVSQSLS